MSNLLAKPIVKNKYWIVEQDGEQVGTLQASPSGISFVKGNDREKFVSIKLLRTKYNITFAKEQRLKKISDISFDVYGFPCDHKPFNVLIDIIKKIPIYTKANRSKSFFCAGHYLVHNGVNYAYTFCPKLITLNRYDFFGPFQTKVATKSYEKTLKNIKV
jgi:hypothetical protein